MKILVANYVRGEFSCDKRDIKVVAMWINTTVELVCDLDGVRQLWLCTCYVSLK